MAKKLGDFTLAEVATYCALQPGCSPFCIFKAVCGNKIENWVCGDLQREIGTNKTERFIERYYG